MSFCDEYLIEPELYHLAREDLPEESMCCGVFSPEWLENATEHEQLVTICKWFASRFTDPVNVLPYNSREGGYIWIDGGPYDARDEVECEFAGLVPDEVLEKAIEIIEDTGIYGWSLADPYEKDYELNIDDADESIRETRDSIGRLISLLENENQDLNRLLFAAMISILETYLWRTMSFACSYAGVPEKVLDVLKVDMAEVSHNHLNLRERAERKLANVLWQRDDKVSSIFKGVLDMNVSLDEFKQDKLTRHNIVHRFGRDKQGNPVYICENDVRELAKKVLEFCENLHENIKNVASSI